VVPAASTSKNRYEYRLSPRGTSAKRDEASSSVYLCMCARWVCVRSRVLTRVCSLACARTCVCLCSCGRVCVCVPMCECMLCVCVCFCVYAFVPACVPVAFTNHRHTRTPSARLPDLQSHTRTQIYHTETLAAHAHTQTD
jgi:hypothetical protein